MMQLFQAIRNDCAYFFPQKLCVLVLEKSRYVATDVAELKVVFLLVGT